jgi:hypothetical protein
MVGSKGKRFGDGKLGIIFSDQVLYMRSHTFSATDEEIKSFVCKRANTND